MGKIVKRVRTLSVLAMAVMAVMALGVGTALAQETYPPPVQPSVVCVAAGQAGLSVTCTVTGFQPGEQLQVTATAPDGTVVYSATLTADAQGEASFRFNVPARLRGQTISVQVLGATSGAVASTTVTTAATPIRRGDPVPPGLARTGQDALLLTAVGIALLGGGVAALRRRSTTSKQDRTHAGV
jgi:LPXTG-motif cell wall-anchored protein